MGTDQDAAREAPANPTLPVTPRGRDLKKAVQLATALALPGGRGLASSRPDWGTSGDPTLPPQPWSWDGGTKQATLKLKTSWPSLTLTSHPPTHNSRAGLPGQGAGGAVSCDAEVAAEGSPED